MFFDNRLAIQSPQVPTETIINGVRDDRALVAGWEANAFDVLARMTGPSYLRTVAAGVAKFFPWATPRQQSAGGGS
jgi:hypothetical protein